VAGTNGSAGSSAYSVIQLRSSSRTGSVPLQTHDSREGLRDRDLGVRDTAGQQQDGVSAGGHRVSVGSVSAAGRDREAAARDGKRNPLSIGSMLSDDGRWWFWWPWKAIPT